MAKLTKAFIDRAIPPENGYALHWDSELKGFGLRVTKTGRITYFVMGRVKGKSLQFTIGTHGVFTPSEAREEARELLRDMRKGIDPRQVKKESEAAAITLRQVADDYMRNRPLRDSTKKEIEMIVTTVFKAWLHEPIASITTDDVNKRFGEMRDHGLHGDKPAPIRANAAFSILKSLFTFAEREHGKAVISDNPVRVLKGKWSPTKPRTRRIPENKIGEVFNALQAERNEAPKENTRTSVELVLFLLLTGTRIGEASSLTWDRVDLDEKWFHLPDTKSGNPLWLPLSDAAHELLTTINRVPRSPYCFPSWGKSGHIVNPLDTMKKVSAIAGRHLSPHDLRRTYTTLAISTLKIDVFKTELITNHSPTSVVGKHYLETSDLRYLQHEVNLIGTWITEQAAVASGDNVVQLDVANSKA